MMHFTVAITAFVAAAAASPIEPRATSYSQVCTKYHNLHRANHSATPIVWDKDLAVTANTIASNCNFAHNMTVHGGGYGQNIAAGVPATNVSAVITELWYNSEANNYANIYGQAQPSYDNFGSWGHFSQIVWNASTKLGCATINCATRGGVKNTGGNVAPYMTVCNYKTPGNFAGQYAKNIFRPRGDPIGHWNSIS